MADRGRPQTWLTWSEILDIRRIYQVMNKGFYRCDCGNNDPANFTYHWQKKEHVLRLKCVKCLRQNRINSQHDWFCSGHDFTINAANPTTISIEV